MVHRPGSRLVQDAWTRPQELATRQDVVDQRRIARVGCSGDPRGPKSSEMAHEQAQLSQPERVTALAVVVVTVPNAVEVSRSRRVACRVT